MFEANASEEFAMRNQKMSSVAAGAMLFGGMLGVASSAEAGLTWDSLPKAGTTFAYEGGRSRNYVTTAYGVTADSDAPGPNWSTGLSLMSDGRTVSISATTASGFSTSIASTTSAPSVTVNGDTFTPAFGSLACRYFQVVGSVQVQLFVAALNNVGELSGYSGFFFWKVNSSSNEYESYADYNPLNNQSGTYSVNLAAGFYRVDMQAFSTSPFTGTAASFTVVPAPGALALLGCAGLVAGRRRRS